MNCPRLWIYNYDFEFELAEMQRIVFQGKHPTPWYFLNRSPVVLIPLADEQDSILIQELPDDQILKNLKSLLGYLPKLVPLKTGVNESNSLLFDLIKDKFLVAGFKHHQPAPWGWSPLMYKYMQTLTVLNSPRLTFEAVKLTNSKQYSNQIRTSLLPTNFHIPSTTITDSKISQNEIETILGNFQQKHSEFFIKHFYGTSGNLSDYCNSRTFSIKKIQKWRRWILKNHGLLLEKFIPKKQEISIQVDILPDRTIVPVAATELYNANNGSYIGNILSDSMNTVLKKLYSPLLPAFEHIADRGYYGPLGVDLIETENGEYKLIEINARLTMGRVAVEWHKKINQHKTGLFANLFFRNQKSNFLSTLQEASQPMERNLDCKISILNSVYSEISRTMLITIFIAANTKNIAIKAINKIKPSIIQ